MPKAVLGILAVVALAGWAAAFVYLNKSGDLGEELEASEAERAELTEKLEAAGKDLDQYRRSAGALEEVGQKAGAAEERLAEAEQQLRARQDELMAVSSETRAGKTELTTLEANLRDGKAQASELEQQIAAAKAELESLRTEAELLRSEAPAAQPGLQAGAEPPEGTPEAVQGAAATKAPDRMTEARQRFDVIDQNGDGKLDPFEIRLNSVKLLSLLDANRDGYVTIDETLLSAEQFKRLDLDGDGKISAVEFVDGNVFRVIDAKDQGYITFEDYLAFIEATVR